MKHQLHALRDARRYRQAFAAHWAIRHQLDPQPRREDELAFLPAHLELTDSPLSPLPLWSLRLIAALFIIALLWSALGQLDIVAVAGGKTVSGGRTKILQPLEPSVVKAIHVRDGQQVQAGQVLIELDATGASADKQKPTMPTPPPRWPRRATKRCWPRWTAAGAATAGHPGIADSQRLAEESLALGQWRGYQAKLEALNATLRQRQAEHATTRQQVSKLQAAARIAEAREHDYQDLLAKNFISKHAYLDKQQARIEQAGDLASQQSRLQELDAAIAGQAQERQALQANFRSDALDKLREAREQMRQYGEDQKDRPTPGADPAHRAGGWQRAATGHPHRRRRGHRSAAAAGGGAAGRNAGNRSADRKQRHRLRAAGTGGHGQSGKLPYTRYGYLDGVVDSVSHDAMQDEKKGLVFLARIRLKQDHLSIDGARVRLSAGMTVSAEIKTGRRRVIDYFLSPLQQHVGEGLRER